MGTLKVLALNRWMKDANSDDEDFRRMFEDCVRGRYPVIEPRFNRDGYYFDRKTKVAWFEVGGRAWRCDRNTDFLYELRLLNARRLSRRERMAIRSLIAVNNCPQTLREQLALDGEVEALRQIRLDGLRAHRRFLAFKAEHGLTTA